MLFTLCNLFQNSPGLFPFLWSTACFFFIYWGWVHQLFICWFLRFWFFLFLFLLFNNFAPLLASELDGVTDREILVLLTAGEGTSAVLLTSLGLLFSTIHVCDAEFVESAVLAVSTSLELLFSATHVCDADLSLEKLGFGGANSLIYPLEVPRFRFRWEQKWHV